MTLSLCLVINANAANTPGLNYSYYEGTWSTLPDFNTLLPVKKGVSNNVTLTPANRNIQYAFLWQGFISIPAAGNYTFETNSDDGSKLYIGAYGYNATAVVNNDGIHPGKFVTGTITLNAGVYPISISFFQNEGGQGMEMYWSSNTGITRQKIADNVLTVSDPGTSTIPASANGLLSSTNNYYFSTTSGNDSRTPAQALNPATPWKTIAKLNAIMPALQPGDAVLFQRNDVFTGNIIMAKSGTAALPIVFSAYGAGNKPVINGLSMLKTWVSLGNGIWESDCGSGAVLNLVLLNEINQGMGRYPNITEPNRGYLTVDSHSGTSQITDSQLGSSVNWTGAEIVVRKNDWVLDRGLITGQSGNTLNFVSPTGHQPTDGYGYFIQNSPLTLDRLGEWYYNPATKKLRMFFGSANPSSYSVKASIRDTLVYINNKSYLTFDNICFRGADVRAIGITNSSNITIQKSDFNYTGLDAIFADNSPYLRIENNTINHSNNSGIRLNQGSNYASIKSNAVKNSGLIPGMGISNNQQHDGIFVDSSPMNTIELNTVDSSGYCGIVFTGSNTNVKNNVVNYFCLTVNDGGGIYTWGDWDKVGRTVTGNVVLNGIGAPAGTNSTVAGGAVGIYTDDRSTHIDITNNTIANCSRAGVYLHNSHEMNLSGNTLYNNGIQISMVHDALEPADPIRNNVTTNNIIASNRTNQLLVENISMLDDIGSFGSYDNNYYTRPFDDNGTMTTVAQASSNNISAFYNLAGWTTKYGYDLHSSKSPLKIPAYTVNKLIGANKFTNGNFNSDINGMYVMSSPGNATASFNSGGKLDGGAIQVTFDVSSGATNDVGAFIDFGSVTAGKTYVIRFSLLGGSANKTMKAFILQNGGNYGKLSETKYFVLSTTRTENEFLFTAPSSQSNAMIALETAGKDCPYWLDNFQVFEAEITVTNPDSYIRFEYNATSKAKTISLSGNYVDAKNKAYSGNITISPFSSVILMKPFTATTSTQSANEAVTLQMSSTETAEMKIPEATALTVKVSPNPAREKIVIDVNLPANTQAASGSIYSLSGIRLKSFPVSSSTHLVPVDVSSFNNGMYIINIAYDGNNISRKFVKQ
ncbi:MAG: right-handed parallel beta-helix repeat-containing protein [Chitinophagaceae bacterium]